LGAFFAAVQTGDVKKVESFLSRDARAALDGGGRVKTALNVIHGAEHVARLFIGLSRKVDPGLRYEIRQINDARCSVYAIVSRARQLWSSKPP
jgi:hypothetical protein